jgi:hypothetical protein
MGIQVSTQNATGDARGESETKTYVVTAMVPSQFEVEAKSLEGASEIAKSITNKGKQITFPVYGEARREAKPFPLTVELLTEEDEYAS